LSIGTNSGSTDTLFNTSGDTTTAVITLGSNLTVNQAGRKATFSGDSRAGSGIVNAGTVNAGVNGGTFAISSAGFDNHGSVHSSNGDLVNITSTTVSNSGKLWADGGNIVVSNALGGAGSEEITGNGSIEFGSAVAAGQTVTLDPGSTGTLKLDSSSAFAGTVAGLAPGNFIDFADIAFGATTTLGYTANADNSGGTLSLSDGVHAASIALLGNYMAASFVKSSDGHGGTFVTDPPPNAQSLLTLPHG
jgi:hypothetical protein